MSRNDERARPSNVSLQAQRLTVPMRRITQIRLVQRGDVLRREQPGLHHALPLRRLPTPLSGATGRALLLLLLGEALALDAVSVIGAFVPPADAMEILLVDQRATCQPSVTERRGFQAPTNENTSLVASHHLHI